jgi:hypothetical protein
MSGWPTIHEPIRFQITRAVTGLGLSVAEHQVMIPSTRNVFYTRVAESADS